MIVIRALSRSPFSPPSFLSRNARTASSLFRYHVGPMDNSNRNNSGSNGFDNTTIRSFVKTSASIRKRIQRAKKSYKKPTSEIATTMPISTQEMDNSTLITLSALGHHDARREVLKRHIMNVDGVSYEDAEKKYQEISDKNDEYRWLISFPYRFGIFMAVTTGAVSLPMVFHLPSAMWFNEVFVTTDIPDAKDLETIWQVGAWTWTWCEPALGTISFVLLALQFSRAQIQNLGIKPYTEYVKQLRGERLAKAFPQYDASLIISYSATSKIHT